MDFEEADRESISDQAEIGRNRESDLGRADHLYQLFSTLSDRMEKRFESLEKDLRSGGRNEPPCDEMNREARSPRGRMRSVTPPPNGSSQADGMVEDTQEYWTTGASGKSKQHDRSSGMSERRKEGDLVEAINLQNYERVARFEGRSFIEYTTFIREFDRKVGDTSLRE